MAGPDKDCGPTIASAAVTSHVGNKFHLISLPSSAELMMTLVSFSLYCSSVTQAECAASWSRAAFVFRMSHRHK